MRKGGGHKHNIPAENRQHNVQRKVLVVCAAPEVDGQGRDEEGGRVEDAFAGSVAHCVGVGVGVRVAVALSCYKGGRTGCCWFVWRDNGARGVGAACACWVGGGFDGGGRGDDYG